MSNVGKTDIGILYTGEELIISIDLTNFKKKQCILNIRTYTLVKVTF